MFTFESFVSDGTFGIQSLRYANAELILCVRLRSFLLAVVRRLTTRTNGTFGLHEDDGA